MFRRLRQGFRFLFRRARLEDDLQREVGSHLQMEIDRLVAAGETPAAARRLALRAFGSVDLVTEEIRDVRGMTFWDQLVQDVRFGVRTLRRSPGYTLAAVLILALGIGANTAMFSVIDGVLLKPLPFRDGKELVLLQQSAPQANNQALGVAIPELWEYRERLQSVRDLVEYHGMSFVLLNQGEPDEVATGVVSANFFDMLGVRPVLGRTFHDKDDDLGAEAVLVLGHEYWRQKFGADPNVIGRVLQMNNRPHTVVGVLPAHPQYPRDNDVYMPTSACPFRSQAERTMPQGHRSFAALRVFGRLAPGTTEESASVEIATVASAFSQNHPADYRRVKAVTGVALSLKDQLVTGARPMLAALAGATMLVLLIACANVANLTMARTMRRQRELALRTVLGASRGRLFRQLLTESVIVALAGGLLGVGLAWLSLDMLVTFVGRFTARTGQVSIDAGVLWFAFGIAVLTGVVFGAAPALAARRSLAQAAKDGGAQAGDSGRRHRLRAALVVAQVAVSFVLVVGAALLLQSFHRLSAVPLGYETRQVMTANISGNFSRLATTPESIRVQSEVLARLRSSAGVQAAAVTSAVPLSNIQPFAQTIRIKGQAMGDDRTWEVDPNIASEGFFESLGIPVERGRGFRESDSFDAPVVAVINESMAAFWNGADPIGAQFRVDGPPPPPGSCRSELPLITVIGVVKDFRLYSADREVQPQYYQSFRQTCFGGGRVIVRTSGDPRELPKTIKAAVYSVDAEIPVEQIQTLEQLKEGRLAAPGLTAALLSLFAAVALVITLAGITGVIGTSVSQRTREFGLRMALGASRVSVLRMVVGQGFVLAAIGVAIGTGGAYAFSQLITRFLFATTPTDAAAYAIVALVFVATTALACFGPARRATSIDPLKALRTD